LRHGEAPLYRWLRKLYNLKLHVDMFRIITGIFRSDILNHICCLVSS